MRIILSTAMILFFSGCSQKTNCDPEIIHVKTKVPRLITLYQVPSYQIKDFSTINDTYIKVNAKQLRMASQTSQKRKHNINFYEKQNAKFNQQFGGDKK